MKPPVAIIFSLFAGLTDFNVPDMGTVLMVIKNGICIFARFAAISLPCLRERFFRTRKSLNALVSRDVGGYQSKERCQRFRTPTRSGLVGLSYDLALAS